MMKQKKNLSFCLSQAMFCSNANKHNAHTIPLIKFNSTQIHLYTNDANAQIKLKFQCSFQNVTIQNCSYLKFSMQDDKCNVVEQFKIRFGIEMTVVKSKTNINHKP